MQTRRRIDMDYVVPAKIMIYIPIETGSATQSLVAEVEPCSTFWAVLNFCVLIAATTSDTLRQHHDRSRGYRRSLVAAFLVLWIGLKSFPEVSYREASALAAATHPQTYMYMYVHSTMISADYSHCSLSFCLQFDSIIYNAYIIIMSRT